VKFKPWRVPGLQVRPEVDIAQQAVRFRERITLALKVVRPVPISDRLVEVFGFDIVAIAEPFDLILRLMRDALADEECSPSRRGRRVHPEFAEAQEIAVVVSAVVPVERLQGLRWRCE
jgi:hypothetical protein